MSKSTKGNKTKQMYGDPPKRSEYDDGILRNNQRTGNRLKMDMHYYDRAQKVIMRDLGKESLLLQNKLETDRKTLAGGLYGSKFGMTSLRPNGKYTPTSPRGHVTNSFKGAPARSTSRVETKFPWDKDAIDNSDKETSVSLNSSPVLTSKHRFKTPTPSAYSARGHVQTDDFLASILNEAMNDELLYTQRPEVTSQYKIETPKPQSSRRKSNKTPRRSLATPLNDSIANALMNTEESDEVLY